MASSYSIGDESSSDNYRPQYCDKCQADIAEECTTTAVARSVTPIIPIVNHDLINKISELPENEFWKIVDIRLNRPKKLQIIEQEDGQKQAVIIDQNDKPSIVERWTEECLIDELFLQLATTKNTVVSHNGNCGITVWKYYDQAFKLYRYIPLSPPPGQEIEAQYRISKFIINLSDLTTRLYAELRVIKDPQYIAKQAVGRLFENIMDPRTYHLSIAPKLRVELSTK
jgi:hypothetical protein